MPKMTKNFLSKKRSRVYEAKDKNNLNSEKQSIRFNRTSADSDKQGRKMSKEDKRRPPPIPLPQSAVGVVLPNPPDGKEFMTEEEKERHINADATKKSVPSLQRLLKMAHIRPGDETFVVDPLFASSGVKAPVYDNLDEFVKEALVGMMFSATILWGIYFYWYTLIPRVVFAHQEIGNVFLPHYYWSNIGFVIFLSWVAGIYCLIMSVYTDPRKWKCCCKPRRVWRWVPYVFLLLYLTVTAVYWIYQLNFIPSNLHSRMNNELRRFESNWQGSGIARDAFPLPWIYIQNYYQCCGIKTRHDWINHQIPIIENPYPYKNETCIKLKYGVINNDTEAKKNCINKPSGDVSQLGIRWPASCCNNETEGCVDLPTNTEIWRGHCLNSEIFLTYVVLISAICFLIFIIGLGISVFYKMRIMETLVMKRKAGPPAPHF